MKRNVKLVLGAAAAAVVVAGGTLVAVYRHRLQGQAPTVERLLSTPSGGTPHYEPIQYRAKDSRPAITEPVFVAAGEAKMAGGTMGIGVSIDNESRFYPLFVLQYHQIVNDTCGGKKVACSY